LPFSRRNVASDIRLAVGAFLDLAPVTAVALAVGLPGFLVVFDPFQWGLIHSQWIRLLLFPVFVLGVWWAVSKYSEWGICEDTEVASGFAGANQPSCKIQAAHSEPLFLSFLDDLNPQQREAVETTEGPVLILAGAGSGKTRVITYRIAYLIDQMGVMPESILAMTFTNKAASEMAERVEKLVGRFTVAKPVISTFHSFCVRVLRRDIEALRIPSAVPGQPPIGLTKNFVIYDESDQQQVVKGIMRRVGLDDKQLTPRTVLSRIRGPRITCLIHRKFICNRLIQKPSALPTSTRSIGRNCARRTRWTSMTCSSKRCVC